jgi:hypothetical protein
LGQLAAVSVSMLESVAESAQTLALGGQRMTDHQPRLFRGLRFIDWFVGICSGEEVVIAYQPFTKVDDHRLY